MRISTSWFQQQGLNAMLDQQAALAKTQQEVATGRRLLSPSDDPSGSARALDLNHLDSTITQYQRNIDSANARLSLEDLALGSVTDVLQRVRELSLEGINDTQTYESRTSLAYEIRQRLSELVQLANRQDANGEYIFAGTSTHTQPFVQSSSGVSYAGDQNSRSVIIAASETISIGDAGSEVFQLIPNGNGTFTVSAAAGNLGTTIVGQTSVTDFTAWDGDTYTIEFTAPDTYRVLDSLSNVVTTGSYDDTISNTISFNGIQVTITGTPTTNDSYTIAPSSTQDIFATLDDLASALETPSTDYHARATLTENLNRGLDNLDQALDHITTIRARTGTRLNLLTQQQSMNDGLSLQIQTSLSSIQDVDYASAVSRLSLQEVALQAAQQSFVKVQNLSLFNFLR